MPRPDDPAAAPPHPADAEPEAPAVEALFDPSGTGVVRLRARPGAGVWVSGSELALTLPSGELGALIAQLERLRDEAEGRLGGLPLELPAFRGRRMLFALGGEEGFSIRREGADEGAPGEADERREPSAEPGDYVVTIGPRVPRVVRHAVLLTGVFGAVIDVLTDEAARDPGRLLAVPPDQLEFRFAWRAFRLLVRAGLWRGVTEDELDAVASWRAGDGR